jgi:hypothetical protein
MYIKCMQIFLISITYINEIAATDWTAGVQFFPTAGILFSAGNVCRVASQATGPEHQTVNDRAMSCVLITIWCRD